MSVKVFPFDTFESVTITSKNQLLLRYLVLIGHASTEGDLLNTMIGDYIQKHHNTLKDLESWQLLTKKSDEFITDKLTELIE
jgi:hypothetical protein